MQRRPVIVALRVWAVIVLALASSRLFVDSNGTGAPRAAPAKPSASVPTSPTAAPGANPLPAVEPAPTTTAARPASFTAAPPAEVQAPPPPPPTTVPPATVPPAPVANCKSNVPLAESPDAPFAFLCLGADDVPITWPSDSIRLYTNGLSPLQSVALQPALTEWQDKGRFTVTMVDSPENADVVLRQADLGAAGGRTKVDVWCDPTCVITHADVRLSSTQPLTPAMWIAAIEHEFGHAAGLSHVSRMSEVMYPDLSPTGPVLYGAGDEAGLTELAKRRPS